jgi:hypothetical protein
MHVGAMSQILPLLVSFADNYLCKPRIQSTSAQLEPFANAALTWIIRHSLHLLTFLMYYVALCMKPLPPLYREVESNHVEKTL